MHDQDKQIAEQVKNKLAENGGVSALDIHVNCLDGVVQLVGVVDVLAEKTYAEELARLIPGVKGVENALAISTDHATDDAEIKRAIEQLFLQNKQVDTKSVGVDVHRGVAVLTGHALNLAEEQAAMKAAAKAYGVKEVQSQIKVGISRLDDATLINWSSDALANKLSHPDVALTAENGTVTMTGWVQSPQDVELAEELLRKVEGVKQVKNLLHSRTN